MNWNTNTKEPTVFQNPEVSPPSPRTCELNSIPPYYSSPYATHTLIYDNDKKQLSGFGSTHCKKLSLTPIANKKSSSSTPVQTLPFFEGHQLIAMTCSYVSSLVVTDQGVFGFGGRNAAPITQIKFFNGHNIRAVSSADFAILVVSDKGLFSIGTNGTSPTSLPEGWPTGVAEIKFQLCHPNEELIACYSGYRHNLVVTTHSLYAFGSSTGTGFTDFTSTPRRIAFFDNKPIVRVACGYTHNFVLTATGELYGWGSAQHLGQTNEAEDVAFNSRKIISEPTQIDFFQGQTIHEISCGAIHTLFWTNRGVYALGYSADGQSATPADKSFILYPNHLEMFDPAKVVAICASGWHSLVLTTDGLYGFGRNRTHELGASNLPEQVRIPTRIDDFEVSCFRTCGFFVPRNYPDQIMVLLLARELDPGSAFFKHTLPLDLFKLLLTTAQLGKIPKNWKNKHTSTPQLE